MNEASIGLFPTTSIPLDDDSAKSVLRLMEALDDHDDVQNVWANFDISEEVLAAQQG